MKNRLFRAFKILVYGTASCGLIFGIFLVVKTLIAGGELYEDLGVFIFGSLIYFVFLILFINACFDEIQNFNKPMYAPAKNVIFITVFGPAIKYLSRKNFKPTKGTPEQEAKSANNLKVLTWILLIIFFVAYGLAAYRNVLE